jgi:23S rRNA (cytosine1962-C5)-methyltransferase
VDVRLRRDLARAIREGHPWLFREAVDAAGEPADGAPVRVFAKDSRCLATGFWSSASPIAVRILEPGPLDDLVEARRDRLRRALRLRAGVLDLRSTTAFRWVHGEADRLPGLHLDLYGDVGVARFDGGGARAFYRDLPALVQEIRPLQALIDRGSGETLAGRAPDRLEVLENGLRFEVHPGRAGKGGLFLDQRDNRALVERLARDAAVLNLFGATGAFSLYAARGGARSTDTVDVARPALEVARRNFRLNGLSPEAAGFHVRDVFEFLEDATRRRRAWDLVVSDPPSFAPNRKSVDAARRAYVRLHRLAASVAVRGGVLCAASCSSHFPRADFLASIEAGVRRAGRRFRLEDVRGPGPDHPPLPGFPEGDYLKFAVGRVD